VVIIALEGALATGKRPSPCTWLIPWRNRNRGSKQVLQKDLTRNPTIGISNASLTASLTTSALKAGEWFRLGLLVISLLLFSPGHIMPDWSGESTYCTVQFSGTTSQLVNAGQLERNFFSV